MQRVTFLSFFFISFSVYALSHYPGNLPNNNLKKELADQTDRVIIKNIDWFSAAVDGHTYYRTLESDDFYHGIGYWMQARTEFRPSKFLGLNMRSIFYSGSISSGYTSPTGNYHLFGINGVWPTKLFGGKLEVRAMDIERQTVGEGLLIEAKEMAGVWFKWSRGGHSFKLLGDGTGSFMLVDDVINTELRLFSGLLTAGAILWNPQTNLDGYGSRENSYYYFASTAKLFGTLKYQLESGVFNKKYAALFSIGIDYQSDHFSIRAKAQGRFYGNGFAEKFVGNIENLYISYDQYNKDYTDASNVFVIDDNVYVYSLIMDLKFFLSEKIEFHTLNEVGRFDYQTSGSHEFYYYRLGLTYYPLVERRESLTFFVSNKVLRDSYMRPPYMYSSTNEQLFKQKNFIGFEASFRF